VKEILLEENPEVSIVIPMYNAAKWVGQTLDSLVKQSFKNFEILVVDDGSTDDSKKVVDQFSFDRRLKYFYKENGGTGSALNHGHERARGRYVTWCASDNIYYKNFVETLYLALKEGEKASVELVYSDFHFIAEDNRAIELVKHERPQTGKDLIEGYDIGMSFMYTKALWDKAGPFWEKICEDFNFAVKAAQYTNFGLVKMPLAGFRIHGDQLTQRKKAEGEAAAEECRRLARELFGGES